MKLSPEDGADRGVRGVFAAQCKGACISGGRGRSCESLRYLGSSPFSCISVGVFVCVQITIYGASGLLLILLLLLCCWTIHGGGLWF